MELEKSIDVWDIDLNSSLQRDICHPHTHINKALYVLWGIDHTELCQSGEACSLNTVTLCHVLFCTARANKYDI